MVTSSFSISVHWSASAPSRSGTLSFVTLTSSSRSWLFSFTFSLAECWMLLVIQGQAVSTASLTSWSEFYLMGDECIHQVGSIHHAHLASFGVDYCSAIFSPHDFQSSRVIWGPWPLMWGLVGLVWMLMDQHPLVLRMPLSSLEDDVVLAVASKKCCAFRCNQCAKHIFYFNDIYA